MSIQFSDAGSYRPPAIRKYAVGFGLFLALSACWLIAPQVITARSQTVESARMAAAIAIIRGDLWAQAAAPASSRSQELQPWQISALSNAVRLAPVDARSWLRLARARLLAAPAESAVALKMSFYTGPTEDRLIPEYLKIISRLDVTSDEELQYLLERQIDKILHHLPALRPDLVSLYQETSPQNQILIEKLVAVTAPDFASALRAAR